MRNTVFLFSGQGSQYSGMGRELFEKYPGVKEIYSAASDILGFDLAEKSFYGTEEELSRTEISQPAIMACSLAAFEAARISGIEFSAVAGHSLGEYAAMVASGMLSAEDGFKIIKLRAAAMQKAAENSDGAMCAVIGIGVSEIERVCAGTNGYAAPANYNSSVQTVIAGEKEAVSSAAEKCAGLGAKTVMLNVSAAFHSKLMESAADEFLRGIGGFKFKKPSAKFFSNLTGGELTDFSDIKNMLAMHIISPVRFVSELENMEKSGYTDFVELGPGKVLTGLVRKTLKGVNAVNIENIKTLEKAVEILK